MTIEVVEERSQASATPQLESERFVIPAAPGRLGGSVVLDDLDGATSLPLRVIVFEPGGAEPPEQPEFTWTAQALEQVEGHPVVTHAELLTWSHPIQGRVLKSRMISTVTEVHFDRTHPEAMFRPTITDETKVFDLIKRTTAIPKRELIPKPGVRAASQPIRATEEGGWAASGAVGLGVLGLVIVGAALLLGRRL